ncbi:MAG: ABC transporter ATP-binding protein, partial [Bdellovibrionales bacterium]|nr:ABC transporter ATP-binding protein [Bdellovibrionales bacterium]
MQEREQVSPRGRAEESHLSVPTREIGTSEITETSEIPSKPKVDTTLEPLDDINLTPEAQAARAQALEELHTKRAGLKETLKAFGQLFSLVQKNNKLYFWADAAGEVLDTLSPYGYWAGLGLAADAALSGGSPVAGVALIGASMVWDLYSSTVGKYISSLNEQNQTETLYREYYRRLGDYPVQELQSDALRKGQTMAAENFSSAPELISDTFSSGAVIVSTAVATIAMVEASSQVLGSPYWAALIALPLAPRIWTEFLHARDVIRKEEDVANTRRQFEYGDWAFSDNTQLAEVKGLQQKDALGDQTMERYRIIKDADLKVERRDMFRNLPIELGEQAVQAGGLIVLIGALANGSLSYGEMMLPLYALYQLQSDFTSFSEHLGSLAQHIPFATKIMRLMNGHTNDEQAPPQVEHLDWNTGAPRIRIENLSVTHTGHSEPTLKNVDLVIEPNQIIGVVGPNGAGKSTFMGAIAGVFKPSGGAIIAEDADGSNPKNIHRMLPEWRTHRKPPRQHPVHLQSPPPRAPLHLAL